MSGITFGICTFNRKDILKKSAESLQRIAGIQSINIRVYDDCSTEFDLGYLKKLFPMAKCIKRGVKNQGADKNTSRMYEDFLNSGDEWLFNADSDLLYRKDILEAIERYKGLSKGFISFFNCINHNTVEDFGNLVEKDSVGAAGCLLHRDVVRMILKKIKYRNARFDVNFCKMLKREGYRLYATKSSYVQHIGVSGFNSRDIRFDYGNGFSCDSLENANSIEETFETYIKSICRYKKTKSWKLYDFIVSIPRRSKRVLLLLMRSVKHERY